MVDLCDTMENKWISAVFFLIDYSILALKKHEMLKGEHISIPKLTDFL